MKKLLLLVIVSVLAVSCSEQNKESDDFAVILNNPPRISQYDTYRYARIFLDSVHTDRILSLEDKNEYIRRLENYLIRSYYNSYFINYKNFVIGFNIVDGLIYVYDSEKNKLEITSTYIYAEADKYAIDGGDYFNNNIYIFENLSRLIVGGQSEAANNIEYISTETEEFKKYNSIKTILLNSYFHNYTNCKSLVDSKINSANNNFVGILKDNRYVYAVVSTSPFYMEYISLPLEFDGENCRLTNAETGAIKVEIDPPQ